MVKARGARRYFESRSLSVERGVMLGIMEIQIW
jgi:hypothetical protein